jgi:hypothetical protein
VSDWKKGDMVDVRTGAGFVRCEIVGRVPDGSGRWRVWTSDGDWRLVEPEAVRPRSDVARCWTPGCYGPGVHPGPDKAGYCAEHVLRCAVASCDRPAASIRGTGGGHFENRCAEHATSPEGCACAPVTETFCPVCSQIDAPLAMHLMVTEVGIDPRGLGLDAAVKRRDEIGATCSRACAERRARELHGDAPWWSPQPRLLGFEAWGSSAGAQRPALYQHLFEMLCLNAKDSGEPLKSGAAIVAAAEGAALVEGVAAMNEARRAFVGAAKKATEAAEIGLLIATANELAERWPERAREVFAEVWHAQCHTLACRPSGDERVVAHRSDDSVVVRMIPPIESNRIVYAPTLRPEQLRAFVARLARLPGDAGDVDRLGERLAADAKARPPRALPVLPDRGAPLRHEGHDWRVFVQRADGRDAWEVRALPARDDIAGTLPKFVEYVRGSRSRHEAYETGLEVLRSWITAWADETLAHARAIEKARRGR